MSGRSSVQDVVRIIVTRNPYIYRGLRMRVVNYSALARYIQDEVERVFGEGVDPNTIVTAIMRLGNQALESEWSTSPLHSSRINVVTGVSEVMVRAPPVKHSDILQKVTEIGVFDSYMASLHQTSEGIRIITNSLDAEKMLNELSGSKVEIREGYAEIHIRLPASTEKPEGALTLAVDTIAQIGVHAIDASLSEDEISLVLREDDASRAFEALRSLTK